MLKTLLRFLLLACTLAQAQPSIDTRPVPMPERPTSSLPAHWQHGAFMEIFVRAWKDSNGDGIGDLRGLTQTLDYLKDLGIRGIWLMPVTKNADGDHGYATTDFRDIAPEYGTLADFDELLREAHARGIGVIMDYVINHSAAQHPLFEAARQGPGAPYRDWYVWSDEAPPGWWIWDKYPWYPVGTQPWLWKGEVKDMPLAPPGTRDFYFGTFGPHMPDFNFDNPAVMAYHLSSLRFWLNRGLDGFRLDAVPHLVETSAKDWNDQPRSRALTKQLQDQITAYPRRYVVCEATAEPQQYGDPAVCGGAFAFGFVQHYVEAARGKAESVHKVAAYYRDARPTMATFVSNHDIFAGRRLWDQLEGNEAQYRLAAAGYLLQAGTPFVYFGEEIGQAGATGLGGDLPLRSPLSWAADRATGGFTSGTPFRPLAPNLATHNVQAALKDPRSLLHWYRTLIGLRNTHPSIARGSFEHGFAQGLVAGWQRKLADGAEREHSLVLINYGTAPTQVRLDALPPGARLVSAMPAGGATAARIDAKGAAALWLAPQSVRVLLVRSGAEAAPARKAAVKKKPGRAARKKLAPRAQADEVSVVAAGGGVSPPRSSAGQAPAASIRRHDHRCTPPCLSSA
jgi:alpha-amylase